MSARMYVYVKIQLSVEQSSAEAKCFTTDAGGIHSSRMGIAITISSSHRTTLYVGAAGRLDTFYYISSCWSSIVLSTIVLSNLQDFVRCWKKLFRRVIGIGIEFGGECLATAFVVDDFVRACASSEVGKIRRAMAPIEGKLTNE